MRWSVLLLVACHSATPKRPLSPVEQLRATLARASIELRIAKEVHPHPPKIDAIARAFAEYPTRVLVAAQIEYVAIGNQIAGCGDDTVGMVDRVGHGLLIDITRINDPSAHWADWIMGEPSAFELVHHEVFHHFELAHDRALMTEDREWDALNLLGFVYHWANDGEDVLPGFVSSYAMTKVAEDKATLYGTLMGNPTWLCEKAAADEVLRAKIKLLWRRVRATTGTDSFLRDAAPCAVRYST